MFIWPIILYSIWVVVYFIFNFVIHPDKIKEQNYETLYMYFNRQKWAAKQFEKVGPKIAPVLF